MSEFRLESANCYLNVYWEFDGDYIVAIETSANGFSGHANGHVEKSQFESFIEQISHLTDTRSGEARLESAYPGEFEVVIRSIDNLGHLGAFGNLKNEQSDGNGFVQKLEFALEFSPEQIEQVEKQLPSIKTHDD